MLFRSPHVVLSLATSALLLGCPGPEPDPEPEWETSFELGAEVGALLSIWGSTDSEVYAVGGNPDAGVIYRFDGADWAPETIPAGTPLLNWIDGQSGDVWVVGNEGVALRQTSDGWQRLDTGIDVPLWGVWGAKPDDVWAVGGDAGATGDPPPTPVIAHFDGAAWSEVPLPALDRPSRALFKVWGSASDHVFAVGQGGIILYYDGAAWAQVPSGTTKDLISLWGTGADEIVAVGGRSNGVISRWDGAEWTTTVIGESPGLNGVWLNPAGEAWVCGVLGVTGLVSAGADTLTPETVTGYTLHASFGFDDGENFAVGGTLDRSPPWQGVVMSRGVTP